MLYILAEIAAYTALAVLAFLFLANVVITAARLGHNRALAIKVIQRLHPFARLFRLGTLQDHGASRRGA